MSLIFSNYSRGRYFHEFYLIANQRKFTFPVLYLSWDWIYAGINVDILFRSYINIPFISTMNIYISVTHILFPPFLFLCDFRYQIQYQQLELLPAIYPRHTTGNMKDTTAVVNTMRRRKQSKNHTSRRKNEKKKGYGCVVFVLTIIDHYKTA